ncbi:MAG: bile acid:sodium symporter [Pseudomonadota bacterium]
MSRVLSFVRNNLLYLILAALVLGLVHGYYQQVGYLKPLVLPILLLMVYPMMINIKIEEVFRAFKDFRPVFLSLMVNFILMPVLAFVVARLFFENNPIYAVGLYLIALLPTSGMTAAWTGLAKGNINTALVIIAVNLLLSIFLLPIYLKFLVGQTVPFDPIHILKELLYIVVAPMAAGDLTRRMIIRRFGQEGFKRLTPHLSSVSSLGVVMIIFVAMSLKAHQILNDVNSAALTLVPLILFYTVSIGFGFFLGRAFLVRGKMIALVYGTAMRDLSIAVAIAMLSFPGAVLPIALAYAIQVPLAAIIMKILLYVGESRQNEAIFAEAGQGSVD